MLLTAYCQQQVASLAQGTEMPGFGWQSLCVMYSWEVRCWPISEVTTPLKEVRLARRCGLDLLALSSSHFDPKSTLNS